MSNSRKVLQKNRLVIVVIVFTLWASAIVFKQLNLQVYQREFLLQKKAEQQKGVMKLIPRRGTIYDRAGGVLAMSLDVDSIYAAPYQIDKPAAVARELARRLNLGYKYVLKKLQLDRSFVWIKRKVEPIEVRNVMSANLQGIYTYKENKRYYPHDNLASNLLGFAGIDNDGLDGIEYQFDSILKGKPGAILTLKDARRKRISTGKLIKTVPTAGSDIYLTIDSTIQYYLEKELTSTSIKYNCQQSFGIVMNPKNGNILAMSSYPNFNLNRYYKYSPNIQRNRAIHFAFEPGSTFKLVTAAAALEAGVVKTGDKIDCGNGEIEIADMTIRDYKSFGILSFEDVLIYSSNVGIVRIGKMLGSRRLSEYIRYYGFGQKTGVELPGENTGIVRDLKNWSSVSVASISFGQEISVNALQMLRFVSAIANGGFLVKPGILRGVEVPGEGTIEGDHQPERIISKKVVSILSEIMEKVVKKGTGKKAGIYGYRIAGKTGTAQKIGDDGSYLPNKYIASFAGYFPVDDPLISMILVFDEPSGKQDGGDIAAPAFREVAEGIIKYLDIPSDERKGPFFHYYVNSNSGKSIDYILSEFHVTDRNSSEKYLYAKGEKTTYLQKVGRSTSSDIIMPDLHGMSYKRVFEVLSSLGLKPVFRGSGRLYKQYPTAGEPVSFGDKCFAYFTSGGDI